MQHSQRACVDGDRRKVASVRLSPSLMCPSTATSPCRWLLMHTEQNPTTAQREDSSAGSQTPSPLHDDFVLCISRIVVHRALCLAAGYQAWQNIEPQLYDRSSSPPFSRIDCAFPSPTYPTSTLTYCRDVVAQSRHHWQQQHSSWQSSQVRSGRWGCRQHSDPSLGWTRERGAEARSQSSQR